MVATFLEIPSHSRLKSLETATRRNLGKTFFLCFEVFQVAGSQFARKYFGPGYLRLVKDTTIDFQQGNSQFGRNLAKILLKRDTRKAKLIVSLTPTLDQMMEM